MIYGAARPGEPDHEIGKGDEYELTSPDARCYGEGDGKLVAWRVLCFLDLGFDELGATALAIRKDVDRDEVQRLVRAGAAPSQVEEIVL